MDFSKFVVNTLLPIKTFGVLEDEDPLGHPGFSPKATRRPSIGGEECHPGETGKSEIINNRDTFQIKIEAWRYEPEDISVNRDPTTRNGIIVSGKRLDKMKNVIPGTEFTRKFTLPHDVDYNDLNKVYSANGVIIVESSARRRIY